MNALRSFVGEEFFFNGLIPTEKTVPAFYPIASSMENVMIELLTCNF